MAINSLLFQQSPSLFTIAIIHCRQKGCYSHGLNIFTRAILFSNGILENLVFIVDDNWFQIPQWSWLSHFPCLFPLPLLCIVSCELFSQNTLRWMPMSIVIIILSRGTLMVGSYNQLPPKDCGDIDNCINVSLSLCLMLLPILNTINAKNTNHVFLVGNNGDRGGGSLHGGMRQINYQDLRISWSTRSFVPREFYLFFFKCRT